MAIRIYNVTNHNLSGEQLRKVFNFSTEEYAGILVTKPRTKNYIFTRLDDGITVGIAGDLVTSYESNKWEFWVIGAGYLLSVPTDVIHVDTTSPSNQNKLFCIDIVQNNFVDDIVNSDNTNSVALTDVPITSDVETNIINAYKNRNKAIAIGNVLRIPLFSIDGSGNITSIVTVRDKSNVLNYLTDTAVEELKQYCDSRFTHQSGSTDEHPIKWGKVGFYDVKWSQIRHYPNKDYIQNNLEPLPWVGSNSNNDLYLYSSNLTPGFLYINSNHKVINHGTTISVAHGGTGATTADNARKNLGIYYGKSDPNVTAPTSTPNKGDLYFKILT